eukprot:s4_g80.t1
MNGRLRKDQNCKNDVLMYLIHPSQSLSAKFAGYEIPRSGPSGKPSSTGPPSGHGSRLSLMFTGFGQSLTCAPEIHGDWSSLPGAPMGTRWN